MTPRPAGALASDSDVDIKTCTLGHCLTPTTTGRNCTDTGAPIQCPGFEVIEVSRDGTLAVLAGYGGANVADAADRVPAVFIRHPFDEASRFAIAVPIGPPGFEGRGAGDVAFQPDRLFTYGLEQ